MVRPTQIFFFCACYITISSAELSRNKHRVVRALYRSFMRSFNCESEGFHADPDDCTTFYRCIDWSKSDENSVQSRFTSFRFQCGPGTVFEPESENCVHPQTSSRDECRQLAEPVNPEPEPPSDNWGNEQAPQEPQPAYPSQPEYLGSGRPPRPAYVDSGYGDPQPSPQSESEAGNNVDNSEDSGAPEPPPPVLNLPKCASEGFFAIENDCSHFYRCVNNGENEGFLQYAFTCGEGTVFDPSNNICNYASAAGRSDCRSGESGTPNAPDASSSQNSGYPSGSNGPYGPPSGSSIPAPPNQSPSSFENADEKPIEFPGATKPPATTFSRPSATYPPKPTKAPSGNKPGYGPQTRPSSTTSRPSYPSGPTGAGGSGYGPPSSTLSTRPPSTTLKPSYPSRPTGGSGSGYGPPSTTSSTQPPSSSSRPTYPNAPSNSGGEAGYGRPPSSQSQIKPMTSPGNCSSEGFFPIEGDCKKFIRCVEKGNGSFIKYDFECGEGTVWDTELTTCNFPGSVQRPDCGYTTLSPPPTNATTATETSSKPPAYPGQGTKPAQGGSYYSTTPTTTTSTYKPKPSTNKQTTTSKPTTTYKTTLRPMYPSRPMAESSSGYGAPSTTSTTSSTLRPTYPSRPSNTDGGNSGYGPPSTTSSTRLPSSSKPTYPIQPPGGGDSGYGPFTTSSTRLPSTSSRPTYPSGPIGGANSGYGPSPSAPPGASECTSEGFFPVPEDCNKFIRCVNNGAGFTKYQFNCGPGTVWDPENNVCNHPGAVSNCGQSPSNIDSQPQQPESPSGYPETQKPPQQPESPSGYPQSQKPPQQPESPSGYPQTQKPPKQPESPSGYPQTQKPSSTTKSTTYAYTSSRPTSYKTTNQPAYGTSPSTKTPATTKYPTTTTTKPYTTKPSYSTKPANVSTTPVPCEQTTKKPSQIKCEKAGFFPHPDDCKKFYRCVDWDGDKGERFSVFFFDCPEGTIFDPALDTCNYEASVYPPRNCNGTSNNATEETCKPSCPSSQTTASSPSTESTKPAVDYSTQPSTSYTTESTRVPSTGGYSTNEYTTESSTYSSTETPEYSTQSNNPYQTTESTSDSSTYSSTESSTYSSTESSTYSSTESSTYSSTEAEYGSSSTYSSTSYTESSTQSSTEPVTDYYSTEKTTESSSSTETTTYTPGRVNQTCPDLEDDQFAIACPTGFRRHPKQCNMFYQCTISESNEIKVLVFSCPGNTVFDDSKLQCLSSDQTSSCSGDETRIDVRVLGDVTDGSLPPIQVSSEKELCPSEGTFPYENDCQLFYKCKKSSSGRTNGYLYQCPEGYSYWDVSKRCEKNSKTPSCERGNALMKNNWRPTLAPVETGNIGH